MANLIRIVWIQTLHCDTSVDLLHGGRIDCHTVFNLILLDLFVPAQNLSHLRLVNPSTSFDLTSLQCEFDVSTWYRQLTLEENDKMGHSWRSGLPLIVLSNS